MRLLKPAWVTHKDGQPIFSIDVHPDGSRFATGGQGEDAGKIIIWNMAPVRDELKEKDDSVPKILCEMDNHLACVNCVRWSHSGRYLASGGDDKLIMVWQISKYGVGSTVFGSDSKIIESWRPVHTLRGHSGDVLDLAWSHGDVWLASCSIDNTIIVWNAEKFPEQVTVLKGHTGMVKGVTWDPVGKYLASQSDDKSLKVWRTRDWQEEASVTDPFKECGGTTHVLRCDWSPDGHYVVSAHAMNNSGPTAQIIERDGWKTSLDFVGHRKAITVVRFNPGILSKKLKKESVKSQQYTCCAIGSRDKSLSIWLTALKRPLVVTHDLFTNSVLDLSWAQNGTELLCCSCDGTVAYLKFKPEEIGSPLPKADVNMLLEKIYGKVISKSSSNNSATQIIESADILKLQQQHKQQEQQQQHHQQLNGTMTTPEKIRHSSSSTSLLTTPIKSSSFYKGMDISNSPFKPLDKQIETKTADGRRRITPIFISPQPDVGDAPKPYDSEPNQLIEFRTSSVGSTIQVEKQDKVTVGFQSPSSKSESLGQVTTPTTTPPQDSATSAALGKEAQESHSVNVEVQPLAPLDRPSTPKPSEASKNLVDTPKSSTTKEPQTSPLSRHSDPEKHKDKSKTVNSLSVKRKHDKDEPPRKRGRPRLTDKERSQKSTPSSTPVLPVQTVEKETIKYVAAPTDLSLPTPSLEKRLSKLISKDPDGSEVGLEVDNFIQTGSVSLHRLRYTQGGTNLWTQLLSSQINVVAGSRSVFCAACVDCSLSVYDVGGQKILPSIILSSKVSCLEVTGHYVMVITCRGSLYVWNMQKKMASIKNEQLTSLMKREDQLLKASLTTDGLPVLTLSNNKSYMYSPDMACWLQVYDRTDHVLQCSTHQSSKPRPTSKTSGILTSLQHTQDSMSGGSHRLVQCSADIKQLSTISHLESQVQTCLCLKSRTEYKFWLQTYVRYLVQEGLESRLRTVCQDLLGPVIQSRSTPVWDCTVLGFKKRELLREILPYFCENLKTLQRLYTELQDQLDCVDSVT